MVGNPELEDPPIPYQNLFIDTQVPMLLIALETGTIVKANKAAVLFYGYSETELYQLTIDKINQLTIEEVKKEMQKVKELKKNHFTFRHKLANGNIRDVEVYSSPVTCDQQVYLFSVIHDITDRTLAEKQLNLYAQLFTSSNDMLAVIDKDQVYLAANRHYLEMLEKPESDVLGYGIDQVLGDTIAFSYSRYIKRAMKGEYVCYERQYITPSGKKIALEIRYFPYKTREGEQAGIVGVLRDISDQKKSAEKLQYSAAVYQSTSEGILLVDQQGCIADVNPAFISLSGYSKDDLLGSTISKLVPHPDIDSIHTDSSEKNTWRGELELSTKNKALIPVSVTINIVAFDNKQIPHYVCVVRDISYYKSTEKKLKRLARHDVLTGLPNRLMLSERIEEHLARAKRNKLSIYIVFIDLDRFKEVNDGLGHAVGDALLIAVAQRLKLNIRGSDTIARVSGDEFIAVIEGHNDAEEIAPTLDRLINAFNRPFQIDHHELTITISVGISQYPKNSQKAEELISMADSAMYRSKQSGRNQFNFFSPDYHHPTL